MITPDIVWTAYQALHRYFRRYYRTPPFGPRLPSTLSKTPVNRAVAAAEQCAALVQALWDEEPFDGVSPEQYAYYFLWAQTLRCSRRDGAPTELDLGEWRNVGFFPLHVLVGRQPTLKGPAANAMRGWCSTYRWTNAPVTRHFPWIEPSGTKNAVAARAQWQTLQQLSAQFSMPVEDIMATMDPDGSIRSMEGDAAAWHPWIVLGRAVCWEREWAPLWALELLLDDRQALVKWWETVHPAMTDNPLPWLDNAVRALKKKTWLTRWRYFRRTKAPSAGVAPRKKRTRR